MAFWLKYKRNTLAAVGIIMAFFMIGVGILAPIIAPYNPLKLGDKTFVPPTLTWDLREHLFGTDDLGRDILSGSVFGIRISLIIGSLATVISLAVGVPLGAISGYFGGRIDDVLMRVTELFLVIPKLFLAIVLVAFFGSSLWNLILVLGVLSWPSIARLVRGQFLTLKERQFVEASRALGASERTIIFREILPNAMPPVIVNATLLVSSMILTEAGLSFLGLGDPTVMSLGTMLHNAQDFITRAWWMMLFPGLAIFIIALAITLVGEGLNEALNPRQIENK
jgi:peptide/nickel transport system permease protein